MTPDETLEVTRMYSVAGCVAHVEPQVVRLRPFRAPHHTVSYAGLIKSTLERRPQRTRPITASSWSRKSSAKLCADEPAESSGSGQGQQGPAFPSSVR
jgi:Magnesium chelatase, subunit ChlI